MIDPLGVWSEETVAGHPCDLFEPREPRPQAQAVIYLHGVHINRLMDEPAFTAEFGRRGLRIVAPRTGRSWWTDRICPDFDPQVTAERYVLTSVLEFIAARWGVRPPGVALVGTSMGGQGALRLALRHSDTFPIAAAISPAVDFHLRYDGDEVLEQMYADAEAARQDTALLHIHPLYWPRNLWFCCDPADHRWHESAERFRMKLSALGVPHDHDLETTGGGHGFEYYTRMVPAAAKFIDERLEKERRRL